MIPQHKWSIFFADIISVDALDKYYARDLQVLITTPYTGTMPSLTASDAIVRTISTLTRFVTQYELRNGAAPSVPSRPDAAPLPIILFSQTQAELSANAHCWQTRTTNDRQARAEHCTSRREPQSAQCTPSIRTHKRPAPAAKSGAVLAPASELMAICNERHVSGSRRDTHTDMPDGLEHKHRKHKTTAKKVLRCPNGASPGRLVV